MNVDYIVVGLGLAGAAVAAQLMKLQKRFVVFDDPESNSSSRIAAGLFNPVTGKKLQKTWLADRLFPYLHEFYAALEEKSARSFFHPMPIYRPFISIEEQNEWIVRAGEPAMAPYIEKVLVTSPFSGINDPYGGLLLRQCGYLDTAAYIHAVGILIGEENSLRKEVFRTEQLVFADDRVQYDGITAERVIWCTGIHKNEFLNWLPLRRLKGETLSISTSLSREAVINRGVYMVPDKNSAQWRVGSTYYFHDHEPGPTTAALLELKEKTSQLISAPFEVVDHQWGFRPTTSDRRPLLGRHPEYKNFFVFNGLGTKGVTLAPYFSQVLIHWLEKEEPLQKDVDIERF